MTQDRFATPFRKRMANARRYWESPETRLASVNYKRARYGLPPAQSVDEIHTPESRGKLSAARRQRDERGRLI